MSKTTEKKKPATKPIGLMDLHMRLIDEKGGGIEGMSLWVFADEVVRACDDSAVEMRRRVYDAVEKLRDA